MLRKALPAVLLLLSSVPGGGLELIPEPGLGWVVSSQGFLCIPDLFLRLRLRYVIE